MPDKKPIGKWAGISAAVIVPVLTSMLSYMESRDATRAARAARTEAAESEGTATDAKRGARDGYKVVRHEFDRVWGGIDECHERVDALEAAVVEHFEDGVRHKKTRRPQPANRAPASIERQTFERASIQSDMPEMIEALH